MEGGLDKLVNALPILVVNGATLLVVVVILIRVLAKVFERVGNGFTQSVTSLKDEVRELRNDIRVTGHENAVAMGHLTERVSRIEGKIEGIALSRAPEMSDTHEVTGVTQRVPEPNGEDNVFVDPELEAATSPQGSKRTPPVGTRSVRPPRTK
jgi:hypothetical protein